MNWISVKDKLPNENGFYLCFYMIGVIKYYDVFYFAKCLEEFDGFDFFGESHSGFIDYHNEGEFYEVTRITHWMPLPNPPEGKTEK